MQLQFCVWSPLTANIKPVHHCCYFSIFCSSTPSKMLPLPKPTRRRWLIALRSISEKVASCWMTSNWVTSSTGRLFGLGSCRMATSVAAVRTHWLIHAGRKVPTYRTQLRSQSKCGDMHDGRAYLTNLVESFSRLSVSLCESFLIGSWRQVLNDCLLYIVQ